MVVAAARATASSSGLSSSAMSLLSGRKRGSRLGRTMSTRSLWMSTLLSECADQGPLETEGILPLSVWLP